MKSEAPTPGGFGRTRMQSFLVALWKCAGRGAWERRVEGRGGEVYRAAGSPLGRGRHRGGGWRAGRHGCSRRLRCCCKRRANRPSLSRRADRRVWQHLPRERRHQAERQIRFPFSFFIFHSFFISAVKVQKLSQGGPVWGVDGSESARSGDHSQGGGERFWDGDV